MLLPTCSALVLWHLTRFTTCSLVAVHSVRWAPRVRPLVLGRRHAPAAVATLCSHWIA